ncbi:MAG: glycosyltransferase family 2 protein [Bacteroidota bacterium]
MIKLSVIIVNYNVRYFLEQCLISVNEACKDLSSEIIVIDNNSSDDSCRMINKRFPKVNLICNKQNIGFGKANNLAISKAKGEYLLILNPDTFLAEDILQKIIDFAEKKDDFGALGVKMIDGKGMFLPESKRNIPTIKIAIKKIAGYSKDYYANHIDKNKNGKIEILTGAFMLLKRSVFNEIKGFDEDYFMYGEDIDLCYKILNKGYQNYYFGKSSIIHYKGESTIKNIGYLKNFYGAMQIFYNKHFKKNILDDFLQKMMVKMLVILNTAKTKNVYADTKLKRNILIIGNRSKLYQEVLSDLKPKKIEITHELPFDISGFDTIFIDQNYVSNKEIIQIFQEEQLQNLSKRIISKDSNFYLGSDSSIDKGEVVVF